MIFRIMEKDLRKYVKEIAQILNDEALFHQREVPGDQDEFEDRSVLDPGQTRHMLYVCINEMIEAYDKLDERSCTGQMSESIKQIKKAVENLKMKM